LGLHVMMICQDPELVSDLATALGEVDRLTVVESPAAVADHDGREVDAVVVDLPAEARKAVCDQVRERYPGQLVVPVDDGDEVAGWPPDPARRVVVRPFEAAELVAGLEPDRLSAGQAAEARRQARLRPLGTARPTGVEPLDPAAIPAAAGNGQREGAPDRAAPDAQATPAADAAAQTPGARAAPAPDAAAGTPEAPATPAAEAAAEAPGTRAPERLSTDQPLWDPPPVPALPSSDELAKLGTIGTTVDRAADRRPVILDRLQATPEPREAPGRRGVLRVVLATVAALALFVVGALVGTTLIDGRTSLAAAPAATTSPAPPPSTAAPGPAPPPQACADAMDDADAAISYLVAKIRDQRLSDSLKRYGEHARACRAAIG